MRKMKRLITLLMTVVMMMAMSITAFAAPDAKSATVTIKGVEDGVQLSYVKLINEDRTKPTGWTINQLKAFEKVDIEGTTNPTEADYVNWYVAKTTTDSQRLAVLENVDFAQATPITDKKFTVTEAGLYVIKAAVTAADNETPKFTYKLMAANVNFNDENTGLEDVEVVAKKAPNKPDKKLADEAKDKTVEIFDFVDYNVEFEIPYIEGDVVAAKQQGKVLFGINDELEGGVFVYDETHPIVVEMDGKAQTVTPVVDGNKLSIDLSDLITVKNDNRTKKVTLTYTAKVTGVKINNTAHFTYNNKPSDDKTKVDSFTGTLQVEKVAEDGTTALKGAEFAIVKYVTVDNQEVQKFAKFENDVLTGWVDTKEAASKLVTGENGLSQVVKGFDKDTDYYFYETKAPEGYSVRTFEKSDEFKATWKNSTPQGKEIDPALYYAEKTISDTKLVELPFTGGMGTTIFTILGVAIMAMAAALFFATKKNHN